MSIVFGGSFDLLRTMVEPLLSISMGTSAGMATGPQESQEWVWAWAWAWVGVGVGVRVEVEARVCVGRGESPWRWRSSS